MTDEDVIQRVSLLVGVEYHPVKQRKEHHKPTFVVRIRGRRAVELMTQIQTLMSKRRQEAIAKAVACYNPRYKILTPGEKAEIRRLYAEDNNTMRSLAAQFGVSRTAILNSVSTVV